MVKRQLGDIGDIPTREALESGQQESMQNVITLDATPTATAPLVEADEWGVYSGKLYHRVGQTIYEITPSTTITVT